MSVRTRFAPSPTGYLHIGGVRTALFNWLYARRHGGQFLLRIDDTDQERNVDQALAPILHGLKWLGIEWDEGPDNGGPYAPYYQSKRAARYTEAVEKLLAGGFAYRDYATPEELQAERQAAEKEKRPFLYSRKFMASSPADDDRFRAEGRKAVVRLKMPREGKCLIRDHIRGDVEFDWAREQDHVVQRADGTCLYHLASVVDDFDFKITHVIRAEEHLSNTPRQIFIVQSLGYPVPEYAHLPFVAEPGSKNKLSKRKLKEYLKNPDFKRMYEHGLGIAKSIGLTTADDTFNPIIVDFYEQVGYFPEAIVNYLLLVGWSLDDKTEDFSREEMIKSFSLERVTKAAASFDSKKLWAFQDRYMQKLPLKQKVARMLPYLQKAGLVSEPPPCDVGPKLSRIIEACGDRLKVSGDIVSYSDFFFVADEKLVYDEADFQKRVAKDGAPALLQRFRDCVAAVEPFEIAPLEAAMGEFVAAEGIKMGDIVHAVRVATTGKSVGPGLFDCLAILGREASLARIDRALTLAAK